MVERRPTPHDTPEAKAGNTALHYIGLAVIVIVLIAIIAWLVT